MSDDEKTTTNLIDLDQSNTSYFSRNSTFTHSMKRSSTIDHGAPSLQTRGRSRGVSDSYNISYASLHRVILKSDFQAISPELLDSQKRTMQEHNVTLTEYARRNKELNEAIAKKFDQLREYKAKRISDGDVKTAEARRNAVHLGKNTKAIVTEMEELKRHRVAARAIDLMNQNLRGDISNYERRILDARDRIEAIRKTMARCEEATEEEQGQIGDLEKEVAAKKLRAKRLEEKRDERVRLIAQLVSGTDIDVDLSKIFDGDFNHEHLVIEMKRLRDIAMKEAKQIRIANEMENEKMRLEYKRVIKESEKHINEYNLLKKAYYEIVYSQEQGADQIKILQANILAIEERIRENEAEYANSEEIADLLAQIQAKTEEVARLKIKLEEETIRKRALILQIEGKREKLDPELRKMNVLIKSMTVTSKRRMQSSSSVNMSRIESMNRTNSMDSRFMSTTTVTTTRPRQAPAINSSTSESD